jgi:hypothetical protein
VVIGGGQEAVNVTMTDRRAGKFEAKFYHKVTFYKIKILSANSRICSAGHE